MKVHTMVRSYNVCKTNANALDLPESYARRFLFVLHGFALNQVFNLHLIVTRDIEFWGIMYNKAKAIEKKNEEKKETR